MRKELKKAGIENVFGRDGSEEKPKEKGEAGSSSQSSNDGGKSSRPG